ncbi:Site-specific recombinase XerD [Pedococcus cremeus]|uniref:Site-specific recombinase XerD n=1 Tax=Pedococcus cremeus TaxID=587636 RepID=A0A1H9S5G1_9MICO|nr:site-specific integrase [Pedococcus cremeus]SER80272.1 Site-specific recombinase XerD [Pedococcus cremeus]
MANGVTRRGDSWRARYRNPRTGKQYQRTFKRQAEAQRWLRDQVASLDRGAWIDPSAGRITFADYFARWSARQVWTDGTHKAMSLAVRSTPFGDVQIRHIAATDVEAWVKAMSQPSDERARPLAPGTIKTRFTNVRAVFRAAVRDEVIAKDPTEGVRLPRQRKREAAMTIPTPDEVRAMLEAADERFRGFVGVCAFAGLRLGEAAALQVADVDFLRRQITVSRQVQRAGAGKVEIRLPKYGSERVVPIPDELVTMLSTHVALGHRGDWLFQGAGDTPPHQNTVGYWWRQTLAAAGLSGVRLHDLRHFYASGLIAAGCDVVTVQRALGHAKATTTLETYSHLWPSAEDRTRTAAATLAGEVLGASVGAVRAGGDI